MNNNHDLQLTNSCHNNNNNNNAFKSNKWGLLHVNGEGQEYMGLVVLSMLVATLILGS
jgi:hypothetical protein